MSAIRVRPLYLSLSIVVIVGLLALLLWPLLNRSSASADPTTPFVLASTPEQAGRYLVLVGGCNDCHTPGFMEQGLKVPESDWLTGLPVGWRGPWGTTYASNLRLSVQSFNEDLWVKLNHTRSARPPMPWASLHSMTEKDLRAVYRYIKSLGPAGQPTPAALPPNQEPTTPYLLMTPQLPKPQ